MNKVVLVSRIGTRLALLASLAILSFRVHQLAEAITSVANAEILNADSIIKLAHRLENLENPGRPVRYSMDTRPTSEGWTPQ